MSQQERPLKTPQQFFEELRAESMRPHSNEREKNWLARILVLAQEAGLYTPEKP